MENFVGLSMVLLAGIAGFFGLLALLYFILKFMAVGLNALPFFQRAFVFFILSLPAFILLFVWLVFFKRIKHHHSKTVRFISYIITIAALLFSLFFYGRDVLRLFQTWNDTVTDYFVYGRLFLILNIAMLFVTATLQALTAAKEKDWMER